MEEIKIRLKKIIYDSIAIYAGDYVKNVSDMYDSLAFSIADDSTVNIVKEALSGSSIEENQQKDKGMPERVFVRKGSL